MATSREPVIFCFRSRGELRLPPRAPPRGLPLASRSRRSAASSTRSPSPSCTRTRTRTARDALARRRARSVQGVLTVADGSEGGASPPPSSSPSRTASRFQVTSVCGVLDAFAVVHPHPHPHGSRCAREKTRTICSGRADRCRRKRGGSFASPLELPLEDCLSLPGHVGLRRPRRGRRRRRRRAPAPARLARLERNETESAREQRRQRDDGRRKTDVQAGRSAEDCRRSYGHFVSAATHSRSAVTPSRSTAWLTIGGI